MAFWLILILLAATTVVAALLAKGNQGAKASAIGDFQVPTAQEARAIPVLWGTAKMAGPNVIWYGDLKTKPIKQGSLFGSTTIGYKYFLGMQLACCHGSVDELVAVYAGTAPDDTLVPIIYENTNDDFIEVTLDGKNLFGGDKQQGGIAGTMYLYKGSETQSADPYLLGILGAAQVPPYHGLCHAVLRQPYLGTSNYIKNISLVLKRTQGDGLTGGGSWRAKVQPATGGISKGASSWVAGSDVGLIFSDFAMRLGELPPDAVITEMYAVAQAAWAPDGDGIMTPTVYYSAASSGGDNPSVSGGTVANHSQLVDAGLGGATFYSTNLAPGAIHNAADLWAFLAGGAIAGQIDSTIVYWESPPPAGGMSFNGVGYVIYYTSALARIGQSDGALVPPHAASVGTGIAWAFPSTATEFGHYQGPSHGSITGPPVGGNSASGTPALVPSKDARDPMVYDGGTENVHDINGDANPVDIIQECMTNTVWGCGIASARFNQPSWDAAASTLFFESFGLSMLIDTASAAQDIIADVCRHINAVVYTDPATGLWEIKLIRPDYDPATLLHITELDIVDKPQFARGSWSETFNEIKVTYVDRADNFKSHVVQAHESANLAVTGQLASSSQDFKGISNADLANRVAMRELRAQSYPLARVQMKVNRKAWALRMGAPFMYSYAPDGVAALVMRVTSINYGTIGSGSIEIEAAEDVFGVAYSAYEVPPPSGWQPLSDAPAPPAAQVLFDSPFQMLPGTYSDGVYVGASRADSVSLGFEAWADDGTGWRKVNTFAAFCPSGTLVMDYSRKTAAYDPSGFNLSAGQDLDLALGTDSAGLVRGDCLLMFLDTGEICGYSVTRSNLDGSVSFLNIVRGVYDTVPADHAAGTRVVILRDQGISFIDLLTASTGTDGGAGGDQFLVEGA